MQKLNKPEFATKIGITEDQLTDCMIQIVNNGILSANLLHYTQTPGKSRKGIYIEDNNYFAKIVKSVWLYGVINTVTFLQHNNFPEDFTVPNIDLED